MEPKVVEKVVQRHIVERAKSMAGSAREGHGEVPGRVEESVFSGTRCEGFPRRSRGGFGMIFFVILGALWEFLGAPFSENTMFCCWFVVVLSRLPHIGGGGAKIPFSGPSDDGILCRN